MLAVMGRPSLRGVFTAFLVAICGFHLISVTAAALPPNRYSAVVEPINGYLNPYFTQNWRLFAPNPVAEDRHLRFQGAYRAEDGSVELTSWIDWTDVELDLVRHRVVGGRGGYVTNKLIGALSSARSRLTTVQRETLVEFGPQEQVSWSDLRSRLDAGGRAPAVVERYLRYDRATTRLATDVITARHPDVELIAVQYAIRRTPVVPYALRGEDPETKERMRFSDDQRQGWRPPVHGTPRELEVIADFDRRHR